MMRISDASLADVPRDIKRPTYDRRQLQPGVVHIGLGAFHRAHQAPIFETLVDAGDMRWGVVGASLRSGSARDALSPQDGLYSLTIEDGERRETSIAGTLIGMIVARESPASLIEAVASPKTHLVTVTTTEKSYRLDPSSGLINEDDPQVRADCAMLHMPATMPGFLAAGLGLRRDRGLPPVTIASCDNMSSNGRKLRGAVARIARAHDGALGDWIERSCVFPNSMVDRIVPAATDSDMESVAARIGLIDRAPVRTERFSQWVIEDELIGPAFDLGNAGVQITADLAPFERAKLRLLNGAHSAIAYLGALAGIATVDRFVSQPAGEQFIQMLWDELEPTLPRIAELDVAKYRRTLMCRFKNPALDHRLLQIAIDGSQKLPPRLLEAAAELTHQGKNVRVIALGVAAWMRWQAGRTDAGERVEIDDPLAPRTTLLIKTVNDPDQYVRALLSIELIFPRRLANDPSFIRSLVSHLDSLERLGASATIDRFVNRSEVAQRLCP